MNRVIEYLKNTIEATSEELKSLNSASLGNLQLPLSEDEIIEGINSREDFISECEQAISLLNSENVKRVTKPDASHESIHSDRDSMGAKQAVDTDTEGFDGDPIEDNIHSKKSCDHHFHETGIVIRGQRYYQCTKCGRTEQRLEE